jgi:hypothetical protein
MISLTTDLKHKVNVQYIYYSFQVVLNLGHDSVDHNLKQKANIQYTVSAAVLRLEATWAMNPLTTDLKQKVNVQYIFRSFQVGGNLGHDSVDHRPETKGQRSVHLPQFSS